MKFDIFMNVFFIDFRSQVDETGSVVALTQQEVPIRPREETERDPRLNQEELPTIRQVPTIQTI